MTATDELRRLLDGRGVECEECRVPTMRSELAATFWYDRDGNPCSAVEGADDVPDGMLSVQANLAPEQAVEATLGSDLEAENEKLRELVRDMWRFTGTACKKYPRLFDQSAQGGQMVMPNMLGSFEQRMRELGVEVDR